MSELLTVAQAYAMLREERERAEAATVALREALADMNGTVAKMKAMAAELRELFCSDKKEKPQMIQ